MSEPSVEPVELVDLRVQLPECASSQLVTVPSTRNATLDELRELLAIIHVARNLSSYDIYLGPVNLLKEFDSQTTFEEVFTAVGVSENATLVELIIKPRAYNLQSVYQHIDRFRELIGLQFLDGLALADGELRGATRFGLLGLRDVKVNETKNSEEPEEPEKAEEVKEEVKEEVPAVVKLSGDDKATILDVAGTFFEATPLTAYSTSTRDAASVIKAPLRSVSVSAWNPVPAHRQAKGDLLYLVIQTLEGDTLQITAHATGFYINRCLTATFNPEIKVTDAGKLHKHFNLFDLILQVSPLFSKTIEANEVALSAFSDLPESYLVPLAAFVAAPWLVAPKNVVQHPDTSRSQLPLLHNGVDGNSNCRDWNDDVQALKELPKASIDERLLRDQLLSKALFEFAQAASKTAVNIIKGNIPALNPQDPPEKRLYLRNGIFYFMNVNDLGAFDELGDDEAARYTSSKDLAAARVLNRIDAPGVSSLVCCVVDYQGQRVVCQAPVPGIFQGEENKVVYGASVAKDAISEDAEFAEALKPIAELLHLKAHPVELSSTGVKSTGSLALSKDAKGIRGSDGRKYVIDLFHSTPLDIEFIELYWNDSETSYPHKETVLRHEAVEEWWKRKVSVLLKTETDKLEAKEPAKGEEKPRVVLPADLIVLNPDAFTGVGETEDEKADVRELSKFITQHLIPEFLDDIASQISPFDGAHLAKSLHNVGINLRYLGHLVDAAEKKIEEEIATFDESVASNLEAAKQQAEAKAKEEAEKAEKIKNGEKVEEKEETEKSEEDQESEEKSNAKFELKVANLRSLIKVAKQEMISRSVKHILRRSLKVLPDYFVDSFVAHYHNCLLGLAISEAPQAIIDSELAAFASEEELAFTKLTPAEVQATVASEVFIRFRHQLADGWVEKFANQQLLRAIAIKFGIQWKANDYAFTKEAFDLVKEQLGAVSTTSVEKKRSSKKKKQSSPVLNTTTKERTVLFVPDDIIAFVPIVKDTTHRSSLTDELYEVARVHLFKGETQTGLTLLGQLLGFCEQVYGRVHPETSRYYAAVAQVYSELGMNMEASTFGRRACVLSERVHGIDSYEAILAYINAAFFENQNKDPLSSFKLYQQVLKSWEVVYGSDDYHPSAVNTLANLGDLLTELELYGPASEIYQKVLEISERLNGEQSAVSGMIHYRYARSLFSSQKIKEALGEFRTANEVFTAALGPKDVFSKETAELVQKFEDHLKYTALVEAEAKKQQKQAAAAAQITNAKKASELIKPGKKSGNKKLGSVQPDPEIAQKSVEEILQFIEGKKKNTKKAKNGKK